MAPLVQRRTALPRGGRQRWSGSVDLPRTRTDRSTAFAWLSVVVTGATGLALFAVSSALRAVGWAFADVPGAENHILPETTLALFGVAFVGLAVAGLATMRRAPAADPARSRYRTGAAVLSAAGFALAVVGAGRFSARSTADQLRPVLEHASSLNTTGGSNGIVILLVAVLLSAAGLVALTRGRAPAATTSSTTTPPRRRPHQPGVANGSAEHT